MQNYLLVLHNESMTGIISTLKTNHVIRELGENIDHFPFSFITPLSTNNDNISHHLSPCKDLYSLEKSLLASSLFFMAIPLLSATRTIYTSSSAQQPPPIIIIRKIFILLA